MPDYLTTPQGRRLAYNRTEGEGPGVVFLGGFKSDMQGTKAVHLEAWAKATGRAFLRFDYSGHGDSSEAFTDGAISDWAEDARAAISQLTEGPQILVGSSMGGWISLLMARAMPERLAGLVTIAAAPDFTEWGLDADQKAQLERGETVFEDNPYGPDPTPTHPGFYRDAQALCRLDGAIALDSPVRLIHGQRDADVPWEIALRLANRLRSDDIQVTLVKDGDHRLSRPQDIALLLRVIGDLAAPSPS